MKDPIQYIDDKTSLALRTRNALGFAMPPIIPFKHVVTVSEDTDVSTIGLQQGLADLTEANYISPVTLWTDKQTKETGMKLPLDPIMSISGKNLIIRRHVNKSSKRGSIKERWSQEDYDITIAGVLVAESNDALKDYISQLRSICEDGKTGLNILNPVLNNCFDVWRIAVESFDFPFTAGACNQTFTLKGFSDDLYQLLIEE